MSTNSTVDSLEKHLLELGVKQEWIEQQSRHNKLSDEYLQILLSKQADLMCKNYDQMED
ncbi:Uncharacterised protein [uncultured archaeon]|nr:Uncharacterised protein [uncultured archaeon]